MSGLSLGVSVPNLRFVPSTILKLLAFNAQKFKASRDPGHAPFSYQLSDHRLQDLGLVSGQT